MVFPTHGAKGGLFFLPPPKLVRRNGTHDHVFLVNIDTCTSLIENINRFPPRRTARSYGRAMGCQPRVKISPTCFPYGSDRRWCLRGTQLTLVVRLAARISCRALTSLRPRVILPFFMRGGAPSGAWPIGGELQDGARFFLFSG
jgi:hypothetical protein